MKKFLLFFCLVNISLIPVFLSASEEKTPDVSGSWLQNAMEKIREEEYKPSLQDYDYKGDKFSSARFHFANRANNLRAYSDEKGLELTPRVTAGEETWNLKIKSIKAASDKKTLDNLDVVIEGDNIKCTGNGTEIVYSNSENGILQNISIEENVNIEGIDLIIETENLYITPKENRFILNGGKSEIIYKINKIEDANGKEISYRLSSEEGKLSVLLDRVSAAYPIKLITSFTSTNPPEENLRVSTSAKGRGLDTLPDWINESNQEYAYFGSSVSTAGDVNGDGYSDVIVGAYYYDNGQTNEGMVFVYHGSASGLPLSANWTAEYDQADALFGSSVSSAGDVNGDGYSDIIIGAPYYDGTFNTDEGAVFVYHGSVSGLSLSYDWSFSYNYDFLYLGSSVSSAGDVNGDGYSDVIVGAPSYENGESKEGAAIVYHGSPSGLSTGSADWSAESNQTNAELGTSVSSAGDVNGDGYSDVIVGAPYYSNGQSEEGRAYIYHGSPSGLSLSYNWIAESNQVDALFGFSVSSAGDVNGDGYSDVIVGSPYYSNGQSSEGRAYVYHGSSLGLSASSSWTGEANQADAYFGASVSSAGDVNGDGYSDVIVGAFEYSNGESDEGRAFVYHGSSLGLSSVARWTAESNQALAYFGGSVSTAGDVNGDGYSDVIVGASFYDNGLTDEGRVYLYYGNATSLSSSPNWMAESNQPYAEFGTSVSSAGDVNGDGYSDIIMGAPNYDNGQSNEGRIFVYHGDSSALSSIPSWSAESDQTDAHLGLSVSSAGDVNGDGYSDVIAGADGYDNVEIDEGGAFVYHGSSSGLAASPNWTGESDQDSAGFGCSVSSAGDVNGDGYSDVIVGAYLSDNVETNEGRTYVYYGGASGLSLAANWITEINQENAKFGYSVSSAGDVNGDGYSDVIVGAYEYDGAGTDEGRTFVYHGSSGGLSELYNWSSISGQAYAYLGYSVSSAGDINGDGYSDVIVGAYCYDNGQTNEGRAHVYNGSSSGLSASPSWTGESDQDSAGFGCSVSSAGDVNGDGYSDIIVGAPYYNNGQLNEGRTFLFNGSSTGLSVSSDWTAESDQADAYFGSSVSTAGDVNGDGYSDVIVGAPYYDNGQADEGRGFLYYGNNYGISLIPRQYSTDYSHPIQLGNATGGTEVQLNILGRAPQGRGKVKMQWEIKELGQLFDETSVSESASWHNTGTSGITISEDVTGLSEATAYHWRMRLKYDPVTYNGSVYSRWLSIGPNGWNEIDLISTALSGIENNTEGIADLQLNVFPSISTNIFDISFSVSEEEAEEDISLRVYNKAGIMVKNIFTGKKPAGIHTITLNGNKLPNDIYFISLKKGTEKNRVRKVVLLR